MSNSTTMFCNEICRTCGIQCNCQLADECFSMISLFYEFEMTGRSVSFSYLLQYCTNIEVKDNDRLPKTICDICAEKLKICYEFKVMCEKTNGEIENVFLQSNGRPNGNCNGFKIRETLSNGFSDGLERKQSSETIAESQKKENGFVHISLKCNFCQTSFSSSKDFQNHSPKKCSNYQANNTILDSLSNDYDMASEYAEVKYDSPENEFANTDDNYMNMLIVNNDNDDADGGVYDENLTNSTSDPIAAIPFNAVTSNGDFVCCLCDKKLNSLTNLRKHAKSHQRLQNFECRRCDLQFMSKNILLLHYRKVHKIVDAQIQKNEPNESFCFICRKKFQKRSSLFKHMQSHQNLPESPYKCSYCLKCFDTFADFEFHEKFHELNNHERFKCPFCGLIFPIKTQFNPHFQMHFINDRLYDKWSSSSSSSRKTTASSHSHTNTTATTTMTTTTAAATDNSESFKCIYCNKIMSNKLNMMNHLKTKHGEDDSMAKFI